MDNVTTTLEEVNSLAHYPHSLALELLQKIGRLEKKSFPRKEALDFDASIRSKRNTDILVITTSTSRENEVVAYALTTRASRILQLHKLCVAPDARSKGFGRTMLSSIVDRARRGRCHAVELWVDPTRDAALKLYQSIGFVERERIRNYYHDGRDGIRMTLSIFE